MIDKQLFGYLDNGEQIDVYTLKTGPYTARIITYGATLIQLMVPDKNGQVTDVVLGFDTLQAYRNAGGYLGAVVGRFGNRIANGTFSIDGIEYHISPNQGPHALHGGVEGFDKRNWKAEAKEIDGNPKVRLSLISPDGDMGFPGNLNVQVEYLLTAMGRLEISYHAACDAKSPVNLTNHAYFNLAGTPDILNHEIQLECDRYVEVDQDLIPTGTINFVAGTPLDFTKRKLIGKDLSLVGRGYDFCYIMKDENEQMKLCATVWEPVSGRTMQTYTTMPAVQFYTGQNLPETDVGREGHVYRKYAGFCLETQFFPDSPNHPHFTDSIIGGPKEFSHKTVYAFSVEP
ncbi:MAG: aldose epimerase family protein [Sphaerochaetaceae bacterium]|jgi:aldose 1-epimerase|nr:aldose epimerase family protein [Sphaerochaetaceae bacterium]NLV83838.1 galactose mutarotase [Spirochaetales bacterium]